MDASIRDNFVVGHIHAQDHEGTFHIECTPTQPKSNNEHFLQQCSNLSLLLSISNLLTITNSMVINYFGKCRQTRYHLNI